MANLLPILATAATENPDDVATIAALTDALKDAPAGQVRALLHHWALQIHQLHDLATGAGQSLSVTWEPVQRLTAQRTVPLSLPPDELEAYLLRLHVRLAGDLVTRLAPDRWWHAVQFRQELLTDTMQTYAQHSQTLRVEALYSRLQLGPGGRR